MFFKLTKSTSGLHSSAIITLPLFLRTILEKREISLSKINLKKSLVQEL